MTEAPGRKSTRRSAELFAAARQVIPGGVNSPVRAFTAVGGTPVFVERGEGPYLWDADGNRYVDYVMSWGPLIHGHAFPPVVEAVQRAAERGTSFGAATETETLLAQTIVGAMSSVDMVRFVNSGTEATMSALRLARAFTGRDLIVKFAGNYHGHADALLVLAGSGGLTLGVPSSPGIPAGVTDNTLVASYNDIPSLERLFAERGREIAAVIVEPIAGNMGVVPPRPGFLEAIQRLCRASGALFIADEVITGFRVGFGGAQGDMGLRPDLTTLGKIIGGGLPVGAYGGRADIMRQVAPVGPVYQAGTLSGNPLAMAAGRAALAPLQEGEFYDKLDRITRRLADGLRTTAAAADFPVCVNAQTGMLTLFLGVRAVESLSDALLADTDAYGRFFHSMLRRGMYLPPSQYEAWMISAAHTEELVDETIGAARDAFAEL